MRTSFLAALILAPLAVLRPAQAHPVSESVLQTAERLRDQALEDNTAYRLVESLTTEVGPRLAGTAAERRARAWALDALVALGFPKPRISVEPFEMETWIRGAERARIVSPFPQPLVVTALGRSASTGARGMQGELVVFKTFDALKRASKRTLRGKIAYVGHSMTKTQDGSGYAYFGRARFRGPGVAAQKGAKAILVRSVGTHHHRLPHTGATGWPDDVTPIPAVAVSPPDAEQIERIADRGQTMVVAMTVTPRIVGIKKSANIVVDIPGRTRPEEIIIVGGHLDSWDLGTGAVDDGAGVAITTAAVRLIERLDTRPERTIRLVLWGAEEVGLYGAKSYAQRHAADRHILGSESDFGAERVYRIDAHVSKAGGEVVKEMLRLLAPLGVGPGTIGPMFTGSSGPDLSPLNKRGLPAFRLAQDGRDYFDLHHTPDDTFDKIDPQALAQNVAVYAVFLWLAANTEADFRPRADPDPVIVGQ